MKQTPLKPFVLIDVVARISSVEVLYGEKADDPAPFILIVSPQYVARKTYKSLPLSINNVQDYAIKHADYSLRDIAISRRDAGYTTHVL